MSIVNNAWEAVARFLIQFCPGLKATQNDPATIAIAKRALLPIGLALIFGLIFLVAGSTVEMWITGFVAEKPGPHGALVIAPILGLIGSSIFLLIDPQAREDYKKNAKAYAQAAIEERWARVTTPLESNTEVTETLLYQQLGAIFNQLGAIGQREDLRNLLLNTYLERLTRFEQTFSFVFIAAAFAVELTAIVILVTIRVWFAGILLLAAAGGLALLVCEVWPDTEARAWAWTLDKVFGDLRQEVEQKLPPV